MNTEREKVLRELKSKHAAELAARPDLSQDQINAVSFCRKFIRKSNVFFRFCFAQVSHAKYRISVMLHM